MKVASTPVLDAAQPLAQPIAQPKPGNEDNDKLRDEFVKTVLTSPQLMDSAMKNLKGGGRSVKIEYDGKPLLEITSSGPSTADNVIRGFQKGVRAVADVANQFTEVDPLLSLRLAAASVKATVNTGFSQEITDFADKAFIPMVRVATLALDIPQAVRTFRSKESTPIDKTLEVLHVGTDVLGVVGSIGPHFFPSLAKYATPFLATSVAGDALISGYRLLQFSRKVNPGGIGTADVQG